MNTQKLNTTKNLILMTAALTLSVGLLACQSAPQDNTREEIQKVSAKIDALSSKIDKMQVGTRPPKPKRPTVGQLYKVPIGKDDAFRGASQAKVTIVEATEFACPYCAKLAVETDKLLKDYSGDDLKIVSKQFVVHPQTATLPALASCAAQRQGKFPEFEHKLWDKAWHSSPNGRMQADALTQPALDGIAKAISMDMEQFHSDMKGSCQKSITEGRKQLTTLGVGGTPAIYVNGKYYGGPRSAAGLKTVVDAELKIANEAIAKGQSVAGYYDRVIAKGKTRL